MVKTPYGNVTPELAGLKRHLDGLERFLAIARKTRDQARRRYWALYKELNPAGEPDFVPLPQPWIRNHVLSARRRAEIFSNWGQLRRPWEQPRFREWVESVRAKW